MIVLVCSTTAFELSVWKRAWVNVLFLATLCQCGMIATDIIELKDSEPKLLLSCITEWMIDHTQHLVYILFWTQDGIINYTLTCIHTYWIQAQKNIYSGMIHCTLTCIHTSIGSGPGKCLQWYIPFWIQEWMVHCTLTCIHTSIRPRPRKNVFNGCKASWSSVWLLWCLYSLIAVITSPSDRSLCLCPTLKFVWLNMKLWYARVNCGRRIVPDLTREHDQRMQLVW